MKKQTITPAFFTEQESIHAARYYMEKKDAVRAHFEFSNTDDSPVQYFGCLLRNKRDLVIDGNGAEFVFRGHMTPFGFDGCENITLRNMTIDFDPPLVAEGTVISVNEDYAEVQINEDAFPCVFRDNWLYFDIGEEELSPLLACPIHFDADKTVTPGSGDDFCVERVEYVDAGLYRLYPKNPVKLRVGEVFVLRHNRRAHPGIFIENCKNIVLEDIKVHSCGGLGVLAQFSENITMRRVAFLPNAARGRRISSGRDDGLHVTSCRGTVLVEECSFLGLMDDPINIHGCSLKLEAVLDGGRTLRARYMHPQAMGFLYYARSGDVLHILDQGSMAPVAKAMVSRCEREGREFVLLHFEEAVTLSDGNYAIENVSSTAAFVCRNNRFGSCRARGLLISTPKPVVVEGNLFESSGSAILVAGDANYWYESGECHDVVIRKNVFTNHCLSSMYEFCEGIISICPILPKPNEEFPFHKNIRITENVFDTSNTPVLYGFSTKGLTFAENQIFASESRARVCESKALITLSCCSDVEIVRNRVIGSYPEDLLECSRVHEMKTDW